MTVRRSSLFFRVNLTIALAGLVWGIWAVFSTSNSFGWVTIAVAIYFGLLAFDRVIVGEQQIRNDRMYPIGRFSVPIESVQGVGVGRHLTGMMAPTLVTLDGTYLLTALGENRSPLAQVEQLSAHLQVPIEPDVVSFGLKRRI